MEDKKCNGYFTVEASFIMPLVLGLYVLIISSAILLYNRCVISQDCFLVAMRANRFTWAEDNYGEIIYGDGQSNWYPEAYAVDRLQKKDRLYIGSGEKDIQCVSEKDCVWVKYEGMGVNIQKVFQQNNPVKVIREGRR